MRSGRWLVASDVCWYVSSELLLVCEEAKESPRMSDETSVERSRYCNEWTYSLTFSSEQLRVFMPFKSAFNSPNIYSRQRVLQPTNPGHLHSLIKGSESESSNIL